MSNTIVLAEGINDIEKLRKIASNNVRVFSYDFNVHNLLTKEKIDHFFAEDYISYDDKLMIFDTASSLHEWYENKEFLRDLYFDNVNILGILDTAELHMLLIHHLRNFLISKRIIEKEKPDKIIATKTLHEVLKIILQQHQIELEVLPDNIEYSLEWDQIELKFNMGNKPLTFKISRHTYNKIKSIFENIA